MDNSDQSLAAAKINATFEAELTKLAQSWGVHPKTDSRIKNIRKAAEIGFLFDAQMKLGRIQSGDAPYSTQQNFFEKLCCPNFQPTMYGTEMTEGSEEYNEAMRLLKTFAAHIGTSVTTSYKKDWAHANTSHKPEFRHFAHS